MTTMQQRSNFRTLIVVVVTVFLDYLGISLVIPVAAPLFLSANGFFDVGVSLDYRTLILGLLLGTSPFIQFFTSPILGAFADRIGRKPVLLLSVLATGFGHALTAVGFLTHNLPLLFVSRVLSGAGAGNLSAANSAVADVSDSKEKARNFALIGAAIGLGFIFGPYLGGKLSDPTIAPWFYYDTPLWVAAALSLLNAVFILLAFSETLRTRIRRKVDMFTGVRNILRAFAIKELRVLYLVSFLIGFAYNFFTQFFSVFLVARFHSTSAELGVLFAYIGICTVVAQGFFARVLASYMRPAVIIRWAPLVAGIVLAVFAGIHKEQTVYLLIPLAVVAYGLSPANMTALISDAAGKESQGEALGINQSMQALGFAIPPVISGIVTAVSIAMPLALGAASFFLAWGIFTLFHKDGLLGEFHEV